MIDTNYAAVLLRNNFIYGIVHFGSSITINSLPKMDASGIGFMCPYWERYPSYKESVKRCK